MVLSSPWPPPAAPALCIPRGTFRPPAVALLEELLEPCWQPAGGPRRPFTRDHQGCLRKQTRTPVEVSETVSDGQFLFLCSLVHSFFPLVSCFAVLRSYSSSFSSYSSSSHAISSTCSSFYFSLPCPCLALLFLPASSSLLQIRLFVARLQTHFFAQQTWHNSNLLFLQYKSRIHIAFPPANLSPTRVFVLHSVFGRHRP